MKEAYKAFDSTRVSTNDVEFSMGRDVVLYKPVFLQLKNRDAYSNPALFYN